MIKMILAVDQGGAIGWSDGRLAYPGLKQDMRRFKELTTGHTVVMGFNTFASLGRRDGLPNRRNIVLTRKNPLEARGLFGDDVAVISSLDYIKRAAKTSPVLPHTWIIGGKSVYEEALRLDIVDEIYLTLIHSTSDADVVMDTDLVAWKLFALREAKRGVEWEVDVGDAQWDGDIQTTYITLERKHG